MIEPLLLQKENLPECEGIFCFYDERKQPLYIGAAENIKREANEFLTDKDSFLNCLQVTDIKFTKSSDTDLIKLFAAAIRREKPLFNVSVAEQRVYPHLKITHEKFPRLLVTRKIETDEAEYYGAFLPETGVRFLLDFLNRTFRLRHCTVAIDGKFPLPCTQFYEKQCVAPCVKSICSQTSYEEFVGLVRLFLRNDRENLEMYLLEKIEFAAESLDFETATFWRDILLNVQNFQSEKDRRFDLNDAVDSFEIEEKNSEIFIRLVTQRGRKVLGRRVFVFRKFAGCKPEIILEQMLWQFYQYHAPSEIRLAIDFSSRNFLAGVLSRRENRKIKIKVVASKDKKITTERAFGRAKFEFDLRRVKPPADYKHIQVKLKEQFNLKRPPERIECFDVAHISGTNFVAAKAVWENGKFLADENRYWLIDEKNELQMLEKGIEKSFETKDKLPDLVLIDGGKPQLNAALKALDKFKKRKFTIIAAVKPPRRHNEVSHFISETGEVFEMNSDSEAMRMLVRLRDEAHDFANHIHRTQRDTTHFYELANILPSSDEADRRILLQNFGSIKNIKQTSEKDLIRLFDDVKGEKIFLELNVGSNAEFRSLTPLIVPIRYDEPNGDARDLQPLRLRRKKRL